MKSAPASCFGALLVAAGLGLLGTTAWQWRSGTALEEPASPGKTPNPSKSPFFMPMDASPEERERIMKRELEQMREDHRRDVLLGRLYFWVFPPTGLLLCGLGAWLLTASPRARPSSLQGGTLRSSREA